MKQLFVDILTKMTPNSLTKCEIKYVIKNGDNNIDIRIFWIYTNPKNTPKLEFVLPFTSSFNDYSWYPDNSYNEKKYVLTINNNRYFMDFNPVEICEIDRLIYNVFSNYQTSQIQAIQHYLNADTQADPKTTEQKFEEAQEAVANNE